MNNSNGLGLGPHNLSWLSGAQSRSISAENPTGGKGQGGMATEGTGAWCARDLGQGWKVSPSLSIPAGETVTLADIAGPGALQSFWFGGYVGRDFVLRIYWEGQEQPSVECPLADFFALPWVVRGEEGTRGPLVQVNSLMVSVNPNRGLNCFWEMPFRECCRITLENLHPADARTIYFQINYALTDVPDQCAYFHAQFRRVNPLPYGEVYTILDGVQGQGQYVGTAMGWGVNNSGWWGEGEIKFYLDGDGEFPTLCGTGTEDYFGGAYDWEVDGQYVPYSTPYLGMHQVLRPDGPTAPSTATPCTAGMSWTPFGSPKTCASPSRPWAGAARGATCPASTTSARSPSGIRPCPPPPSPRCRTGTAWKWFRGVLSSR